jgi:hypothetical protein
VRAEIMKKNGVSMTEAQKIEILTARLKDKQDIL